MNKTNLLAYAGSVLTALLLAVSTPLLLFPPTPPVSEVVPVEISTPSPTPSPTASSAAPVVEEEVEPVQDTPAPEPVVVPDTPTLTIPSVGFSAELRSLTVTDGVVNPPTFGEVYTISDYSVPLDRAAEGTVYITAHSKRDGSGLGNKWFNRAEGTSALAEGSVVDVAGTKYKVTGYLVEDINATPSVDEVWHRPPGSLVLITCLQNPQYTYPTQNIIIFGELVSE